MMMVSGYLYFLFVKQMFIESSMDRKNIWVFLHKILRNCIRKGSLKVSESISSPYGAFEA